MKSSYKTIFLSVCVTCSIILSACNKQLDKNPLDSISSENFWKTEEDLKMGLTGVYATLRNGFFGFRRPWLDAYSDNAYDRHNVFNFQNVTMGIMNPTSVPGSFYDAPYQGIAACNFFLANVDRAPVEEGLRNVYKGEVQFLRAMYYFELATNFGGVVLYKTTPESVDAAKIAQSSKEEVLAFVHEDLDFAIANLPDDKYNGHAVKGSAMALKARVLLTEEKWIEAAAMAKQIIDGGVFSLAPSYSGLFTTTTQVGNPEIMFSTDFLAPNLYHGDYSGVDVELGWWGGIGVYGDLGEDYDMKNGKKISDPSSGFDPVNLTANRDPRFDITLKVPGEKYINPDGTEMQFSDPVLTPYVMQKYVNLARLPFGYDKANLTDQHIIHIRYADVLLMYAEAKNEATGPDASVYAALNEVRSRPDVGMALVDQAIYNSRETLRDCIRHERRIELALEGLRYFDLKRWKLLDVNLKNITNPGGVQLSSGEKNNLLPFPQSEIDRNPQLTQNTGY